MEKLEYNARNFDPTKYTPVKLKEIIYKVSFIEDYFIQWSSYLRFFSFQSDSSEESDEDYPNEIDEDSQEEMKLLQDEIDALEADLAQSNDHSYLDYSSYPPKESLTVQGSGDAMEEKISAPEGVMVIPATADREK